MEEIPRGGLLLRVVSLSCPLGVHLNDVMPVLASGNFGQERDEGWSGHLSHQACFISFLTGAKQKRDPNYGTLDWMGRRTVVLEGHHVLANVERPCKLSPTFLCPLPTPDGDRPPSVVLEGLVPL
ncbi:hypothetical protein VTJ04DRAFT_8732 [Mycothermus thermophilus]|uniref:uncharacterized protein n=1 Tax=Humicola insolens TaxID=85995 RepID=UPI003741EB1A